MPVAALPPLPTRAADGWRRHAPLLFALAALSVFVVGYWNPVYRFDEYLVAAGRTRLPWDQLLAVITTSDPGAGPLYLLMKPWTAISTDPAWTRIPSLVAMAVAAGALTALARSSTGLRVALLAGAILVALPGTSRWAQDNRMYALATACTVLAVACWWRSLHDGGRRWSIGFAAAVVGMGLFHLYTLAMLPALVAGAAMMDGDRRANLRRTLVPLAVALVVLAPQLALNAEHPTGSPANPPVSVPTITNLLVEHAGEPLALVLVVLAVVGLAATWRHRDDPTGRTTATMAAVAALWVVVPVVAFAAARGLLDMPTLVPRYVVFLLPPLCLLAALGLDALLLHSRPALVLAVAAIAVLALPGQVDVRTVASHSKDLYRLGQLLDDPSIAHLPIVSSSRWAGLTVDTVTYPSDRLAIPGHAPAPVAIVVSRAGTAPTASPYLEPGSAWRPVVRCEPGGEVLVEVVATAGAGLPAADAQALARQLNDQVPRSRCAATAS